MRSSRLALGLLFILALGLPLFAASWRWWDLRSGVVEVHARMPDAGGWSPASIRVPAGEALRLMLTSDDVMHSFAIGQSASPVIDLYPGKPVETTLQFDEPGKYTFYCTRWCGPDHWRMRGTIEVTGDANIQTGAAEQPLYLTLGLDIDAHHDASTLPQQRPSVVRGAALGLVLPDKYLALDYYRLRSPEQVWNDLRGELFSKELDDQQVWDLVALVWQFHASPGDAESSTQLYARDCAACHGEAGGGNGVFAHVLGAASETGDMHARQTPADFTDAAHMLGASPAVLHGKIVRGGMGTGMPYWGPIYTDDQVWALVNRLYEFQFEYEDK